MKYTLIEEKEIIKTYYSCKSTLKTANLFECSAPTILKIIRKHGFKPFTLSEAKRVYKVNHSFFKTIDSIQKAYWLGFILADGGITSNELSITLAKQDIDQLERFKQDIESNHPIKIYSYGIYSSCRLNIRSFELIKDLQFLGITERKSLTVKIPKLNNSVLEMCFWRGVIDGDGCFHFSKNTGQFDLKGSEFVCKSFKDLLANNNILTKTRPVPYGKVYSFHMGGNRKLYKLIKLLYSTESSLINRKRDAINKIIDFVETHPRKS
jgi:hypothetical protein